MLNRYKIIILNLFSLFFLTNVAFAELQIQMGKPILDIEMEYQQIAHIGFSPTRQFYFVLGTREGTGVFDIYDLKSKKRIREIVIKGEITSTHFVMKDTFVALSYKIGFELVNIETGDVQLSVPGVTVNFTRWGSMEALIPDQDDHHAIIKTRDNRTGHIKTEIWNIYKSQPIYTTQKADYPHGRWRANKRELYAWDIDKVWLINLETDQSRLLMMYPKDPIFKVYPAGKDNLHFATQGVQADYISIHDSQTGLVVKKIKLPGKIRNLQPISVTSGCYFSVTFVEPEPDSFTLVVDLCKGDVLAKFPYTISVRPTLDEKYLIVNDQNNLTISKYDLDARKYIWRKKMSTEDYGTLIDQRMGSKFGVIGGSHKDLPGKRGTYSTNTFINLETGETILKIEVGYAYSKSERDTEGLTFGSSSPISFINDNVVSWIDEDTVKIIDLEKRKITFSGLPKVYGPWLTHSDVSYPFDERYVLYNRLHEHVLVDSQEGRAYVIPTPASATESYYTPKSGSYIVKFYQDPLTATKKMALLPLVITEKSCAGEMQPRTNN